MTCRIEQTDRHTEAFLSNLNQRHSIASRLALSINLCLSAVFLPKTLQAVRYQVQYRAPPPAPPGTTRAPEEIEAEMKRVEAEYEKLALVHIE